MTCAFQTIAPRIRNPIAQSFPELLRHDDDDLHFTDCVDQLEYHSVYSDGRTLAHIQEH